MISISMAVLAVFAVSTIAVIVLCRRAPIRDDLDSNPVKAWTSVAKSASPEPWPHRGLRLRLLGARRQRGKNALEFLVPDKTVGG